MDIEASIKGQKISSREARAIGRRVPPCTLVHNVFSICSGKAGRGVFCVGVCPLVKVGSCPGQRQWVEQCFLIRN